MGSFYRFIVLLLIGLLSFNFANAQLQIVSQSNAQALAQRLVGTGVVISNVNLIAGTGATGFFNNFGGTNIGIDSGIVLTNGMAKSIGANWGLDGNGTVPAQNALADTDLGMPGDGDLAASIGVPRDDTHDATILEFDFVPLGDSIKFNYVFSSEEYTPAWVCSFNDAFAFFISGPGILGLKNIALVPNTNLPVSIFNVNEVPGGGCPNNTIYYVNNLVNTFFTHDGHTLRFTALAQVQPCQTYHLKLVIADVLDHAVDSGVFLEAKSLSSNTISIINNTQTDPQNNSYLVEGCSAGSFKIKRPEADANSLTVSLSYAGTATNGVDMQLLPVSVTIPANQTEVTVNVLPIIDNMPEGIEIIKVYALAGAGCGAGTPTDSTFIQIRDYDTLGIIPDTAIICKNSVIQLIASTGYSVYQWDPNPTLSNTAIRNPFASPTGSATTYYCTATEGACHGRDSSLIILKTLDFISKTEINCKGYSTGEIRVSGGWEWAAPVEYSINNGPYQNDSTFSNLPVGVYTIKIKDATGCIDSLVIPITQLYPDFLITGIPITPASCTGGADGTATINVTGGKNPYLFSLDGINFQPNNVFNLLQGNYTVTVRDNNNCVAAQNIFIPLNNIVTLEAGTNPTICEGKSTQLFAQSNANSFSWTPAGSLSNSTIHNPIASPVITTVYYITATTGICSQKDTVTVFVNPAPKANAGPDHTICFGQNVQLTGSGGISYFWYPASFLNDARIASPTAINLSGSITYSLNVIDANGCVSLKRDSVLVTVTRPAIVFAGRDTTLAIGQPLPLFADDVNNIGFIRYEWSPAYGLNDPYIANPTAVLNRDMVYTVTARNDIGCVSSDDIRIKVYKGPDIYVPNAFTPDGNGVNDILRAIPVGIKDFRYFRIYNRWGTLIFTTNTSVTGWDGTIKGNRQSAGTYVWMAEGVDYKGNIVQRKGTVTVIK
jgi:gliding motility-associated-like protein